MGCIRVAIHLRVEEQFENRLATCGDYLNPREGRGDRKVDKTA
jgi:hypothetical protein